MMGSVHVRRLARADVPWAIALTDTEAWGYTAQDFERLLHLEPEGIFVAEAGGERAGITAAVTYGPLAYVGTVIVDPLWRGKGAGEAIMRACLDFCDERGAESVRLNAYLNVVPFYERLGFRREFENRRFAGHPEGRVVPGVRLARADDLTAMAELDARYFGADRARLLRRLLEEFPETSLVLDDVGDVAAFAFGNVGGGSCEIGPFVCPPERASQGEDLLHAMFSAANAPCGFTAPSVNEKAVDAARRAGMRDVFRTVRMVRGSADFGGDPKGIFALAGLEKG